jgi:rod shape-determining protein MreD
LRILRFFLGLGIALLVHFVGLQLVPQFPLAVDLFLVVLVFQGLDGDAFAGLLAGVTIGLVQDTLGGGIYGLYGVTDTVVGYATAKVAQRVVIQRSTGVMLAFTLASAAQQVLLAVLALVVFPDPVLPQPLWALLRVGSTAVIGLVVWTALGSWRARYASWRSSRTSRVHFG